MALRTTRYHKGKKRRKKNQKVLMRYRLYAPQDTIKKKEKDTENNDEMALYNTPQDTIKKKKRKKKERKRRERKRNKKR